MECKRSANIRMQGKGWRGEREEMKDKNIPLARIRIAIVRGSEWAEGGKVTFQLLTNPLIAAEIGARTRRTRKCPSTDVPTSSGHPHGKFDFAHSFSWMIKITGGDYRGVRNEAGNGAMQCWVTALKDTHPPIQFKVLHVLLLPSRRDEHLPDEEELKVKVVCVLTKKVLRRFLKAIILQCGAFSFSSFTFTQHTAG